MQASKDMLPQTITDPLPKGHVYHGVHNLFKSCHICSVCTGLTKGHKTVVGLILTVLSGACTSVALFCRALAVLLLTLFRAKKQILVLLLGRCFSTALSSSPCGTACLLLVSPPHSRDCAGIHSKHLLEEVDYVCVLNGMQVQFHANSSVKDASKN